MSTGLQGPRATLNELKWRWQALDEARIVYKHRGAPDDEATAEGSDIVALGRSFITLERPEGTVQLPYHRVFRIDRGDEEIWNRQEL